jgi:DNA-binding NtrC family response regulator
MALATLLLVDDEKAFVQTISKRLSKRDINVVAAYSGAEALKALGQNDDVEVVILDIKMPGMDGIDTLREIKRQYPLVEVIMLTGHATVESGIEGMKLGAFDYLMKPCDLELLISKVREAAAKKRLHEEKIVQARIKEITLRRPG